MNVLSVLAVTCLLAALCVAIALLWRDRGDRRLLDRLAQVASVVVDEKSARDLSEVVIRRARSNEGLFTGLATQFLKFSPDSPQANIIHPRVVMGIGVLVGLLGSWIMGFLLEGGLGVLAGVGIGLLAIRAVFSWEHRRYAGALQRQLPDMIEMLVSGSRAGLPVTESMRNVAREMQSPTKEAIAEVVRDVAIGRPIDEALLRLFERSRVSEYAIVAVAIGVQRQTGGALAESLQNVAEIVRTRMTIESRANALASEAKASAVILVAMPFVAGGALAIVRPGYLDLLFEDPRGMKIIAFGIASLVAGVLTMRWMIRNAVVD